MRLVRPLLILLAIIALSFIGSYSGVFRSGADVGACGSCGDGACVRACGETPLSCPADCGVTER